MGAMIPTDMSRAGVSMKVASLGQNIYDHNGNHVAHVQARARTDDEIPNTLRLGDAIVDAAETGIAVIRNALAEQEHYQDAVVEFKIRVVRPGQLSVAE